MPPRRSAGRRKFHISGARVNWDEHAISVLISGPTGMTSEEIQRRARAVQRRAQTAAPVKTGALQRSIHVNTRYPRGGAQAEVSSDSPYAMAVEYGRRAIDLTGSDRVLHWEDVFSKRAAAVAATHFLESALDEAGGDG